MTNHTKGRIMVAVAKHTQEQFYKDFLMARQSFNPRDFGVDMEKDDFIDRIVELFNQAYSWTVDELVLHPREGLRFCDDVRRALAGYDLPDDIILRSLMQRRKNPGK